MPRHSIYLPEGLWARIQAVTEPDKLSVSWFASRALERAVQDAERDKPKPAGGKS